MTQKQILTASAILLSGILLMGAGCQQSPAADNGGNMEGGAMGPQGTCEALCTSLNTHKADLLKQKAEELVKGAGCQLGQGNGAASGKMFGDTDYNCPDKASAEKLGQDIQNYKDHPSQSGLDKEISDNQKQIDANCPCKPEQPSGQMQQVMQCVVCTGVPRGGVCPTYFVTSEQECTAKGGTISK